MRATYICTRTALRPRYPQSYASSALPYTDRNGQADSHAADSMATREVTGKNPSTLVILLRLSLAAASPLHDEAFESADHVLPKAHLPCRKFSSRLNQAEFSVMQWDSEC